MTFEKPSNDGEYLCSIDYLKKQLAETLREKAVFQKNENKSSKKRKYSIAYDGEISNLIAKKIDHLSEQSFRPCSDDLKQPFQQSKNTDRLALKQRMRHRRKK